jgi:CcmD family protein
MEDLEYLVAAYTIIWIAISGYVLRLGRKQSQLQREIDALTKEVAERGSDQ